MGVARQTPNTAGGLEWSFELGQNLNAGDPVLVYNDSGAKIKKVMSALSNKEDFGRGYYNCLALVDTDIYVVAYRDIDSLNYGIVRAIRINPDTTVTLGAPYTFWSTYLYNPDICSQATLGFCVTYKGAGNLAVVQAGTVNSVTLDITMGSSVSLSTGTCYYNQVISPAPGVVAAVYRDNGTGYMESRAFTIAGNVIGTPGAVRTLVTYSASYLCLCSPALNKIAVSYYQSSRGRMIAATLTGTTINAPGAYSEFNAAPVYSTYCCAVDTDKVMVLYRDGGDAYKGNMRVNTMTGVTFNTWGTEKTFIDEYSYYHAVAKLDTNKFVIIASDDTTPYTGHILRGTLSGMEILVSSDEKFMYNRIYYVDIIGITSNQYAVVWYDTALSKGFTLVVEGDINTIPSCDGLTKESGLLGEIKKVDIIGGVSEQILGMTPGDTMYIQDDGSISNIKSNDMIGKAVGSDTLLIRKS